MVKALGARKAHCAYPWHRVRSTTSFMSPSSRRAMERRVATPGCALPRAAAFGESGADGRRAASSATDEAGPSPTAFDHTPFGSCCRRATAWPAQPPGSPLRRPPGSASIATGPALDGSRAGGDLSGQASSADRTRNIADRANGNSAGPSTSAAAAGGAAALADVAAAGGTHLRAAGHAQRRVGGGTGDELEQLGRGVGLLDRLLRLGLGLGRCLGGRGPPQRL